MVMVSQKKFRTLDQNLRIADLMYGHPGKYVQGLHGSFRPEKYPSAPRIQICQLKCGCWIIADGNNRVGLLLKENPNATIADLPSLLISIYEYGGWDEDTMNWWNPAPKTFAKALALSKEKKKKKTQSTENEKIFYGLIERTADNTFFALIINIAEGRSCSAEAHSRTEAENRLKRNICKKLQEMGIELGAPIRLELTEVNVESHECNQVTSL